MAVVAVVLGEGLLQKRSPEGLIGAHLREDGVIIAIPLLDGQEIVDDNRVGNAESVEVHRVDALRAHLIVYEYALDAAWDLRKGGDGGQEPAVADRALADICRGHTVASKERVAVELLSSAEPSQIAPVTSALTKVAPEECAVVRGEVLVFILSGRAFEGVEVDKGLLISIVSGLA